MKKTTLVFCLTMAFSSLTVVASEKDIVTEDSTSTETPATAPKSSSYITGNIQFNDTKEFSGADQTATIEAGHFFDNGMVAYFELDAIDVAGFNDTQSNDAPFLTVGAEKRFYLDNGFWAGVGYQHLLKDADTFQYRPLFWLGYNFDNGLTITNRTRFQIDGTGEGEDDVRLDNAIGYQFSNAPIFAKYSNLWLLDASKMDHEVRVTWTRNGFQPYVEYRNQFGNSNNVLAIGGTIAW
ncbi:porin [Vibrio aestuarianus]|uniref:Oligogalacturonate-specific porin KdgM family protein n=1 Tax=Vibrio aestuarianus TaxID=28171 RepID=A0A9X4IT04_9VIBR|nr:porin [Vibrio aestuarianus]MDE1242593.1 oligogalacturonate-specific porin KdgM family protein [Vibrio aestuarianus]